MGRIQQAEPRRFRPAAVRLAQRTRLAELETDIDEGRPALDAAQTAQRAATEAFRVAEEAVKTARLAPFALDKTLAAARDRVESLSRDQTRREARAQALDETVARLEAETGEAAQALEAAQGSEAPSETIAGLRDELTAARAAAEIARTAAQTARSDRDAETRERQGREQRLGGLIRAQEAVGSPARRARRGSRRWKRMRRRSPTFWPPLKSHLRDLPNSAIV